jgi:hypothetical protein
MTDRGGLSGGVLNLGVAQFTSRSCSQPAYRLRWGRRWLHGPSRARLCRVITLPLSSSPCLAVRLLGSGAIRSSALAWSARWGIALRGGRAPQPSHARQTTLICRQRRLP